MGEPKIVKKRHRVGRCKSLNVRSERDLSHATVTDIGREEESKGIINLPAMADDSITPESL